MNRSVSTPARSILLLCAVVCASCGGGGGSGGNTGSSGSSPAAPSWESAVVFLPGFTQATTMAALDGLFLQGATRAQSGAPVAIALHGCTGLGGLPFSWGPALAALGYLVIMPDSLARPDRAGRFTCSGTSSSIGNFDIFDKRIEEAQYAIQQVRGRPWFDGRRLLLVGQSEGGFTVARREYSGISAAVVSGYWCSGTGGLNVASTVPTLTVSYQQDPFYFGKPGFSLNCANFAGVNGTRHIVLPGAFHNAFDTDAGRNEVVQFASAQMGGSSSGSQPLPPLVDSSYKNFKEVGLTPQILPAGTSNSVRAYGDFSGSGRLDLFTATLTYWPPTTPAAATPSIFEFWRKEPNGTFVKNPQMLPVAVGCIHPQKAIVADLNGDGRPDVFIACRGFAAAPFPGERNKIVLSQADGTYAIRDASPDIGGYFGASAADLNGDGLPDVIVTNCNGASACVLLNQGGGVFQREVSPRLPASIGGRFYIAVELVDIDGDGSLDILLGGHEFEGAVTVALLNPGTNNFASVIPITIPSVPNEGVALDFVVSSTALGRTLLGTQNICRGRNFLPEQNHSESIVAKPFLDHSPT